MNGPVRAKTLYVNNREGAGVFISMSEKNINTAIDLYLKR